MVLTEPQWAALEPLVKAYRPRGDALGEDRPLRHECAPPRRRLRLDQARMGPSHA